MMALASTEEMKMHCPINLKPSCNVMKTSCCTIRKKTVLENEIQTWFMFDMYIIKAALYTAYIVLLWRWWYITVLKILIVILLTGVSVYFGIYLSTFDENLFIFYYDAAWKWVIFWVLEVSVFFEWLSPSYWNTNTTNFFIAVWLSLILKYVS